MISGVHSEPRGTRETVGIVMPPSSASSLVWLQIASRRARTRRAGWSAQAARGVAVPCSVQTRWSSSRALSAPSGRPYTRRPRARFLASLWRAAGEALAVAAHALARGCSRCSWSVWCAGGLGGTIVIPEKLQWRLLLPDLGHRRMRAVGVGTERADVRRDWSKNKCQRIGSPTISGTALYFRGSVATGRHDMTKIHGEIFRDFWRFRSKKV